MICRKDINLAIGVCLEEIKNLRIRGLVPCMRALCVKEAIVFRQSDGLYDALHRQNMSFLRKKGFINIINKFYPPITC